jgi:multisubunit Na+/H+ antiporter MnhG subunit
VRPGPLRRHRHPIRGSILILVLAVLAMLTILGAILSRSVYTRLMALQDARRGGTSHVSHATIGEGANGAP